MQALLFRLRADVAALPGDPGLLEKLQDVRSLEYEVDFLTNKCKASRERGRGWEYAGRIQASCKAVSGTGMHRVGVCSW